MEESPHKCPVCSRSFNQRSNLKTHLLTHTDHKPYECNSCGKVFRRNCDLRRHTLTHAVGDVPGEYVDVVEEEEEGRNLSGDEEDSLLEVDSPRHSPVQRHLNGSPTHDLEDDNEGDEELEGDQRISMAERLTLKRKAQFDREALEDDTDDELAEDNEEEEEIPPSGGEKQTAMVKQELVEKNYRKSEDVVDGPVQNQGVTHCHHEGGEQYTMRPCHEYGRNPEEFGMGQDYGMPGTSTGISNFMGAMSGPLSANDSNEPYIPLLHVRRDLHSKALMQGPTDLKVQTQPGGIPQSGALPPVIMEPNKTQAPPPQQQQPQPTAPLHSPHEAVPSFLGSIPIRKRALGVEFEHLHAHALGQRPPPTFAANPNIYALNMSRPHLHALQTAAAASAMKMGAAASASVPPAHLGPPPPGLNTKPGPYLPTNYHMNQGAPDKPPAILIAEPYLHHSQRNSHLENTSTPPTLSSPAVTQSPQMQIQPQPSTSVQSHQHQHQLPPQPQPVPNPAPVKRTGFSIEDIMRR